MKKERTFEGYEIEDDFRISWAVAKIFIAILVTGLVVLIATCDPSVAADQAMVEAMEVVKESPNFNSLTFLFLVGIGWIGGAL